MVASLLENGKVSNATTPETQSTKENQAESKLTKLLFFNRPDELLGLIKRPIFAGSTSRLPSTSRHTEIVGSVNAPFERNRLKCLAEVNSPNVAIGQRVGCVEAVTPHKVVRGEIASHAALKNFVESVDSILDHDVIAGATVKNIGTGSAEQYVVTGAT
jgi:hypothetical protein